MPIQLYSFVYKQKQSLHTSNVKNEKPNSGIFLSRLLRFSLVLNERTAMNALSKRSFMVINFQYLTKNISN